MSGTSLDGIDVVYARFNCDKAWGFEIIYKETFGYDNVWSDVLKNLVTYSTHKLKKIDEDYTRHLVNVIKSFITKYNIETIDAICSHGHTALHEPEKRMTYQIGNKQVLSKLLGKTVVCDFRVQDVALGGQGAPLVPIGDELLFSKYEFCLNLGGFANISTEINGCRIAYDICPVNIVLNYYVRSLGFGYDDKGHIASGGSVSKALLKDLNSLDFYQQKHPKSLGLEWVRKYIFPLIDSYKLEIKTILRTCVEHIAIQISKEINTQEKASVLVTGGGAYNTFLMDRIQYYTTNTIVIPSNAIVEYKEALIFAFLGILKLRNQVNTLKSVTGAIKDHSAGIVYFP